MRIRLPVFLSALPLACALWSPLSAGAKETDPRAPFRWMQTIQAGSAVSVPARIHIRPEIYDGCEYGPAGDLRVFDQNGGAWPFFVYADEGGTSDLVLPATRTNDRGEDSSLREFDLTLNADATNGHDRIRIEFGGQDYMRRVEIFGRENDQDAWGRLGSGFAVRIPRAPPVREDVISYARSTFRHLRIRVHADPRRPGEVLESPAASVIRRSGKAAPEDTLDLGTGRGAASSGGKSVQAVEFEAPYATPLRGVSLTAGGAYARDVAISARNHPTNAWQWVGGGRITHVTSDWSRVSIYETTARYWRVEIQNGDDPPLQALHATGWMTRRWLMIEPRSSLSAALYYGSRDTRAPQYDFVRRMNGGASGPELSLGERVENPAFDAAWGALPAWSRWLAPGGVALASLIVLVVILRMAREFMHGKPPAGPQEP